MARRRTSNASILKDYGCGLVVLALGVAVTILKVLASNPAVGGAVLLLAVLALAIYIKSRINARRQAQAYEAEQRQIAYQRSMEIAPYHAMNPREFEHALAYLCERDGCTQVQVVGGAGDLGADVIATTPDGRRIVIQAKRYGPTTTVGSGDVQKVNGTYRDVHGGHLAAVITTSRFTKPAVALGQQVGIRLYDQHALAGWVSRTGPAPWH